ncbi:unnamed protein product, partial [Brenthis ino]
MYLYGFIFILTLPCGFGEAPANKSIANYDPAELLSKIFNTNNTVSARNKNGLVQFEDSLQPDFVSFKEPQYLSNDYYFNEKPVKFRDDSIEENYNEELHSSQLEVNFQDPNNIKKKRRKKRKPRQHHYVPPYPSPSLGTINPYFGAEYYRPQPRPSVASEAVSRITEALTSIALYDDYQCVARLLCEAAGGGALGTAGILQTVAGLQPLLTLLSAYNGISTNPLFVFGRAVFLGMSSRGNTASCRYGYPQCPTDPEQLVHYLNNHNGGFFRFFSAPQQGQQNVEQFYNQLSQNGLLQPQLNQIQQHYGFYNPNPGNQHYGFQQTNPYSTYNQNYGLAYPYNKMNRIQKRIQNKPLSQYDDDLEDQNQKWAFPSDEIVNNNYDSLYDNTNSFDTTSYESYNKKAKALKFPENHKEDPANSYDRKTRGFSFPEKQSNRHYVSNNYIEPANYFNYNNQYYANYVQNNNDDVKNGLETVYVVRGNGDPNKPEIFKLRPGESVH